MFGCSLRGNSAASNTIDQYHPEEERAVPKSLMRTHFIALVLAFLSLGAISSRAQEDAPPKPDPPRPGDKTADKQDQPIQVEKQDQIPTFRKNVTVVTVQFNVKDKHGQLIPNLPKDRFELFEEGKPQVIKYFSAITDQPLTLGLLIDSSKSMERTLPEEKVVAGGFLQKVLTPKDLAFVISFDVSVDLLQDLTNDPHLLRAGLGKAHINTNTIGMGPMGNPGPVPTAQNMKGTLLFDAVYLASDD